MEPAQTLLVVIVAGVLAGPLVRAMLHRRGRDALAADLRLLVWPGRAVALCVVSGALLTFVPDDAGAVLRSLVSLEPLVVIAAIGTGAWLVTRLIEVFERSMFRRLRIDVADNLRARSRRTQLQIISRVATIFVWVTAVLVGALTFESVRNLGPALVAYAGVIGVVVGLALRSPLESLMHGLMVATTEPIRIDDVVVVDGEFGHVEEINLTHVVLRLWDKRRLVLPTSHFVSERFENWTRQGADLVGTVTLHADYGVPVPLVREELEKLLAGSALWDGATCVLQVVDLCERTVQLRALVSAANAAALWDLRCEVREGLLPVLGRPDALPRLRAEAVPEPTPA